MENTKKSFTRDDIMNTADKIMDVIKLNLDESTDIAEIVFEECRHRVRLDKSLRFANPVE